MRSLHRARLRRAALRFAEHGWPVLPGAYLAGPRTARRFDCGAPGCRTIACHPAVAPWEPAASTERSTIEDWWAHEPYTVLLATGFAFDVLEVPARLAASVRRAAGGPVAVVADQRWMFLVRPGDTLVPELARQPDVVLHGVGSWVPAPPSATLAGRVRWETTPGTCDWRPADTYAVQDLMAGDLRRSPGIARLAVA